MKGIEDRLKMNENPMKIDENPSVDVFSFAMELGLCRSSSWTPSMRSVDRGSACPSKGSRQRFASKTGVKGVLAPANGGATM